ncbi:arsenic resistance protein [Microbacterium sp. ZXX196]|uniref:arsenic resistance protein n=1 Tax=Microbacterium sp. ZXX196 TaxID=2609291 RepID=UPI0012B818BE|nr:arsenic resistance protein [Microbacterium sp. ZXX196]MTE23568.1 arsenic resistance protein [Microbacterium sp. ZXX196]
MGVVGWAERHQVALYLGALAAGAAGGLLVPAAGRALAPAIEPVLGTLLFATFLQVPLARLGRAWRDGRFLAALGVANFVVVPLLAGALSRLVADDRGLLLGLLLVLLTPCVDYVVVFTGAAGGDRARLIAATPLLMLAQIALLPAYLALFAGGELVVDPAPFARAFLLLIALPLALAAAVQALARRLPAVRRVPRAGEAAMVPLMMVTLVVVVASQIGEVGQAAAALARLVPIYAVFALAAAALGALVARAFRLDPPASRAVAFSSATRNSLVVLPLALATPDALAPLAVVTQTLVELVALVALVRVVPWAIPGRRVAQSES